MAMAPCHHLALHDRRYVTCCMELLELSHMDHEVYQHEHIDAIIQKHGWCDEIEKLIGIGQHGSEQLDVYRTLILENSTHPFA